MIHFTNADASFYRGPKDVSITPSLNGLLFFINTINTAGQKACATTPGPCRAPVLFRLVVRRIAYMSTPYEEGISRLYASVTFLAVSTNVYPLRML